MLAATAATAVEKAASTGIKSAMTSAAIAGVKALAQPAAAAAQSPSLTDTSNSAGLARIMMRSDSAGENFRVTSNRWTREVFALFNACFNTPELGFIKSHRSMADPSQNRLSKFFSGTRYLNFCNVVLLGPRSHIYNAADAAVSYQFRQLQSVARKILISGKPIKTPKELFILIIPYVVDCLASLEPTDENKAVKILGFSALSRFIHEGGKIVYHNYYKKFTFRSRDIDDFIEKVPAMLALCATEENQNYEPPRLHSKIAKLLQPMGALVWVLQAICYQFLSNKPLVNMFLTPPTIVGQEIMPRHGDSTHSTQHAAHIFTEFMPNKLAASLVTLEAVLDQFTEYSNFLLKRRQGHNEEIAEEKRLLRLYRSLRHISTGLQNLSSTLSSDLSQASEYSIHPHAEIIEAINYRRIKKRSTKTKVEKSCREFLLEHDRAALQSVQLYARFLLMYNALRTLYFHSRDLPDVAVSSDLVKSCISKLSEYLRALEALRLNLNRIISPGDSVKYLPQFDVLRDTLRELTTPPYMPPLLHKATEAHARVLSLISAKSPNNAAVFLEDTQYGFSCKLFAISMNLFPTFTDQHIEEEMRLLQASLAGQRVMEICRTVQSHESESQSPLSMATSTDPMQDNSLTASCQQVASTMLTSHYDDDSDRLWVKQHHDITGMIANATTRAMTHYMTHALTNRSLFRGITKNHSDEHILLAADFNKGILAKLFSLTPNIEGSEFNSLYDTIHTRINDPSGTERRSFSYFLAEEFSPIKPYQEYLSRRSSLIIAPTNTSITPAAMAINSNLFYPDGLETKQENLDDDSDEEKSHENGPLELALNEESSSDANSALRLKA